MRGRTCSHLGPVGVCMSVEVVIDYENHREERRFRRIRPIELRLTEEDHHYYPNQWILVAWDTEKEAERHFAMSRIHSWAPAGAFNRMQDLIASAARATEVFSEDELEDYARKEYPQTLRKP